MTGRQSLRGCRVVGSGCSSARGLPLLLITFLCVAVVLGGSAVANTGGGAAPAAPAAGSEGTAPATEGGDEAGAEGGHTGDAGAEGGHGGGHGLHPPLCDQPITDCLLSIAPPPCQTEACHSQLTVLIFPFLALIFGIILQPLVGLLRLPYTLLLLFAGALLGAVGCATGLGMLTRSLRRWVHLEPPTVFFFVFLAPLIFEAAYNTEWHVFKRLLIPIVTLAFVIVILQVFAVAVFQLYVLRTAYWNWWTALTFGAMLSATDPISVTATLKSAGASELLNVMIEGESLLNDGSAFVLWEAFFANAKAVGAGEEVESAAQIVVRVLRLSLGGVAMGLLFGLVALLTLSLVYEAFEVETSVLLVVAFLGFWTAQVPAMLSGVICNVTSGLVLSAYARPLISPSVRDPLHHLWEYIAWAANTIVFVYAGLLVTAFTWSCSGQQHGWRDYVYIFIWFGFLQLIRFLFLAAFHPILSWRQAWFTPRHSIFVGLSGLRGAVSLILALEVAEAADLPSEVKSRVVLWTTGIVALSLLVNGLSVSPALSRLGLAKADATRVTFLARARSLMTQKSLAILDTLAVDGGSKAARWSYVRDNVLPSSWLDSSTVDDYVRASIDIRGAMSADVRRSLDIHALNQRMGTTASADMPRSHTTRYGSALPADRDRPENSPLGSTPKGDRLTPSIAAVAGGGRFTPPPGASAGGDRFSPFHSNVGGGAHMARGTGIWGERTPQVSLDIPRRGGAVQMSSSGMRPAPGQRPWGTDLHVEANSPLFLSNMGHATPREPGEQGAFHLDGSTASVQHGPQVRSKKKGRGSAGDLRGGDGRQSRFPGLPLPGRGGGQNGPGGQDNYGPGAQAGVLGRVSGAWDTMRRGVARVAGAPGTADIFTDQGRAFGGNDPNRTRDYAEDVSDTSVESSADVSAEPTYPVSLLSPQRPFRPQFRQQHRTLSGVFREVQRIHDSRSYRVDVGTELDREVRRRVLMAMLSVVRTSFNVSLVDWSALAALSEDLLHALDANEERRPYNLFSNFLGRSFLGKFRVLRKAVSFAGSLFGRTGIESSVAVTSVVVEATTQVLKESWLTESPVVLAEMEQLYDSAVTFLSRLETMDPYHFSCVQTDSTVRLVFHKQEQTLDELREDGAIDAEEFSQLASELSAIRSHYFLVVDRLRRPSRHQSAREVLRRSPLFAQISETTFNRYVAQPGRFEELNVGDVVDQRGGAFLFVCQGALRVGAASLLAHRRQQRLTTNLTKAGIPLAMQPSFIEHTHAGEDAETAALHAGVLPRGSRDASRRRRTHHHHHHHHHHHSSQSGGNGEPRTPRRAPPSPPRVAQAEETPTSEEMDSPPLWPSNPPEPMPALASLGADEPGEVPGADARERMNADLPTVDGLTDALEEGNTATSGGAEQSGSASSPYTSDTGSGSNTLSETDPSGVVDYAAAEAAVRAFDDGEDDDLDMMFEPFSPPNRPPPTPASPAYARRVSMAGRADPAMRLPMGYDGGGGGGGGGGHAGASVGGRSSLQLSTGASMHFCLPRHHLYCGPAALIAVEDIDPSSPRGRLLQSQATAQAVALQFCACETAGEATVFWLPVDALRKLCEEVPTVRNEVARAVARLLVLDGLVDVPPYALAHTRDAVASSVPFSEDPTGGRGGGAAAMANGGDVVLRATHTLAQLPYMSVTRVPAEGITVNGPGVLLVGQLRVTVVDTTGWAGVSLTHNLDAPALLPPGALILDRLDSGEEDNGASAGDTDGTDGEDGPGAGVGVPQPGMDGYMIQARRRRRHTRRRARRVVVTPEVLVDVASSVEDVAAARLNRWTGPPVTVDANGRFGAFPHVDYNTVAI